MQKRSIKFKSSHSSNERVDICETKIDSDAIALTEKKL